MTLHSIQTTASYTGVLEYVIYALMTMRLIFQDFILTRLLLPQDIEIVWKFYDFFMIVSKTCEISSHE